MNEVELSQSSVAVKVTVTEPATPQSSSKVVKSLDHFTPPQLSEALAPPLFANHASIAAALPSPLPS